MPKMTKAEAEIALDKLGDRPRRTVERIRIGYRELRAELMNTTTYLGREQLYAKCGGSMGTIVKYFPIVEALEGPATEEPVSAPTIQLPGPVAYVLDTVRSSFDRIPEVLADTLQTAAVEEFARHQAFLQLQKNAADAKLAEEATKSDDLDSAAQRTSQEAEEQAELIADLREMLSVTSAQLDATKAQLAGEIAASAVCCAELAGAEAQIDACKRAETHLSAELDRLLAERAGLVKDAERSREFKAEVERLRHRLVAEDIRHRDVMEEIRQSHAREIVALQAQVEAQTQRTKKLEDRLFAALAGVVHPSERNEVQS